MARKNGPAFRVWQFDKKKKAKAKLRGQEDNPDDRIGWICPKCFTGVPAGQRFHKCPEKCGEAEKAYNLLDTLPKEVAAKVAASFIANAVNDGASTSTGSPRTVATGGQVLLPSVRGGRALPIQVGTTDGHGKVPKHLRQEANNNNSFSHEEILTLKSNAGLSGQQMEKIMTGMRVKLGRGVVDSNFKQAEVDHNNQYIDYFTGKFEEFEDKDGNLVKQPLV